MQCASVRHRRRAAVSSVHTETSNRDAEGEEEDEEASIQAEGCKMEATMLCVYAEIHERWPFS